MTGRETLEAAKALIDKPEKWVKGKMHSRGRHCALGALAIARDYGGDEQIVYDRAYRLLLRAAGCSEGQLSEFNDSHSHAELMAAFDRAIEAS